MSVYELKGEILSVIVGIVIDIRQMVQTEKMCAEFFGFVVEFDKKTIFQFMMKH